MGSTVMYVTAIVGTAVASFLSWKAVEWWEAYRCRKRAARPDPPEVVKTREKSKELSMLTARVAYNNDMLIAESKLAPTRVA